MTETYAASPFQRELLRRVTGETSAGNSSNTPLDSEEEFTGAWEINQHNHACINVLTDQDGTLFVEFAILKDNIDLTDDTAITDEEVTQTFGADTGDVGRAIYANSPYFRPIVKMPGRAMRVRFENGSVAQGAFALLTSYGNNLFPASSSPDNELLITETERERNVFAAYGAQNVSGAGHAIMVDLSDTATFKHERTGRVDVSATYFQVDKATNATGVVRLGVITRIDETNADVAYVQGIRFDKSSDQHIERDRNYAPSQLKLGVDGSGNLTRAVSSAVVEDITAINTGLTLPTSAGSTATPGKGDVVVSWEQGTSSYDFSVSMFYHGEVAV